VVDSTAALLRLGSPDVGQVFVEAVIWWLASDRPVAAVPDRGLA
jgi:hypothetical protein